MLADHFNLFKQLDKGYRKKPHYEGDLTAPRTVKWDSTDRMQTIETQTCSDNNDSQSILINCIFAYNIVFGIIHVVVW